MVIFKSRIRVLIKQLYQQTCHCHVKVGTPPTMKILNVAEKNDAAKNISGLLSGGNSRRREGFSPFNKIYEFEYNILGQRSQMVMTSVSGHLLGLEFVSAYRSWQSCNPLSLFDAPVLKMCPKDYEKIKKTLEREVRSCGVLIIWTDCDREGENIGFEIIQVCQAVKPNIRVYRAKFSEITAQSVHRAAQNLIQPNKNISDAVDVRQELDLRIGAAFTRFQTLRLQKVFPSKLMDSLISYGSCQFPTLGFVVERYKAVESFIPEAFWKIVVKHTIDELTVIFSWKRVRLFDELVCQVFYEMCMEQPTARVESVSSKPKSKWRPLPLDTVELEKLASRKLKISARETMSIAEKLYNKGFISYPRTETNIFPREMNLRNLVELHTVSHAWGEFAGRVLQDGPNPRAGKKSDQAHPPIHPTKYTSDLQGNEHRLYEFIVRHFLACCSKDAEGLETVVEIDIAGEKFVTSGLMIIARNYLDVYPYEKWNAKEIHIYQNGQTFEPTNIEMVDGETSPPNLLTEADLIALMEKHGIGTDATHAEHIETIKQRLYVGLQNEIYFVPGCLGMGLVEGYDSMGFAMSKPNLRSDLEADLKHICEGRKDPKEVLREQLAKYKEVFRIAIEQAGKIDEALGIHLNERPQPLQGGDRMLAIPRALCKCPRCGMDMVVKERKENNGCFVSCIGFPACRQAVWLPRSVEKLEVLDDNCPRCGPNVKLVSLKFRPGPLMGMYDENHVGCLGGCDHDLLQNLEIEPITAGAQNARTSNTNHSDSGYGGSIPVSQRNSGNTRTHNNSARPPTGAGSSRTNSSSGNARPPGRSASVSSNSSSGSRGSILSSNNDYRTAAGGGQTGGNNQEREERSWNAGGGSRGSNWFSSDDNSSWRDSSRADTSILRMTATTSRNSAQHDDIVCGCNINAILLTVRKEGPNTGRQFYKCANPDRSCNFFMWADTPATEDDNAQQNVGRNNINAGRGFGNSSEVTCICRLPAKLLTVQKDTPNKGRQFYSCPKGPGESGRCNFFKWADEVAGDGDSGSWGGGGGGGGGGSSWSMAGTSSGWRGGHTGKGHTSKRSMSSPGGQRKKRKCGLCGEEGHIRTRCPSNRD